MFAHGCVSPSVRSTLVCTFERLPLCFSPAAAATKYRREKAGRRGDLIGRSLPIGRAQRRTTFLFVRLRRVFYACFRSCVCFSFLLGARTRVCAVCYPCCSSGSVIRQLLLRFIDLKVFLGGFILFCASRAPPGGGRTLSVWILGLFFCAYFLVLDGSSIVACPRRGWW